MKKMNYLMASAAALLMPSMAFAEEAAAAGGSSYHAIAKGFAIGVAALGCALAQGKIVSSAVEGISRNPGSSGQVFTPMLLGVAFVETLLIFTLFLSGINA
jgi:F-type H+-transporting ATPase subunit c